MPSSTPPRTRRRCSTSWCGITPTASPMRSRPSPRPSATCACSSATTRRTSSPPRSGATRRSRPAARRTSCAAAAAPPAGGAEKRASAATGGGGERGGGADPADADKFDNLAKIALQRQISEEKAAQAVEPTITAQTEVVEKLKVGLNGMKQKL